jgi:hypothetical protein
VQVELEPRTGERIRSCSILRQRAQPILQRHAHV